MKNLFLLSILLLASCQPVADSIQEEVDLLIAELSEELDKAVTSGGLIIHD